ncbi:ExeM/NucH family extracellular endonuclease [Actinomarinicola tropica]|uniref:ExeM/NucH family extracellular endonuclease n=1 Tax=Actinomarinicola tropica TaxID=2789776 RepID=A0A5Q2RQA6_9ACTN|nr:ExeM/NucH family extracellular endonuclease [Actinomarinicola tropica]QGG95385.1 ExeM/NucH family extracellular endonuclease [Actinomarinicola tropica]
MGTSAQRQVADAYGRRRAHGLRGRVALVAALLGMLGLAAAPPTSADATGALVISGVIDGPLTGGLPKAVELTVVEDIDDLSAYGLESASNGQPSVGPEMTLPAGPASAGDRIHVATESPGFEAFFGFPPDATHGNAVNINGDDAIVLWHDGARVDVFGEIGVDGTGTPWEHTDGWAYRRDGTGQDGAAFQLGSWSFSGVDALDGAATNDTADVPFPIGTYSPVGDPGGPGEPDVVDVHDVQGAGAASPLLGTTVTVDAVVVGDFQAGRPDESGDLGGFFVQEPDVDADDDPTTSEGLFVFHDATDVAVGDLVTVTGTVSEFATVTQLTGASVTVDASGVDLPSAAAVVLPTSLEDPAVDWERHEGMRTQLDQALAVTEQFTHGRYGEVVLSAIGAQDHPNQVADPASPDADAVATLNQLARIQLDDGRTTENPDPTPYLQTDGTLRDGDLVSDLVGVVHFSFGDYEIHPVVEPTFQRANDRPPVPDVGGSLRFASFNVLNYFTTLGSRGADTAEELEDQAGKIVAALVELDADVVGLIEIENNAPVAVDDLVARLNAAGTRTYAAVPTGPIGTDEIAVAFIYDTATVELVGEPHVLDAAVSPAYLDDLNRPALAQTFRDVATGGEVTAAINHLKSKGSACTTTANPGDPAYGVEPYTADPEVPSDRQGNCNLTRTAAAQVLGQWLAEIDPTGRTLILGDLNSYANEDPIRALEALGYRDLVEATVGGNSWDVGGHTYVFDGEHGSLDYAMAGPGLLEDVTGAAPWHVNADEPPALDYNDWNPDGNIRPDPFRSSDHDPVLVGLALPAPAPTFSCNGLALDEAGWRAWASDNGYRLLLGSAGPDLLVAFPPGRPVLALGGDGDDLVVGSARDDVVCAGPGHDLVVAGAGDDHVEGGPGNDLLLGGPGRDVLRGGPGDDVLLGGPGRDDLDGGSGRNLLM